MREDCMTTSSVEQSILELLTCSRKTWSPPLGGGGGGGLGAAVQTRTIVHTRNILSCMEPADDAIALADFGQLCSSLMIGLPRLMVQVCPVYLLSWSWLQWP